MRPRHERPITCVEVAAPNMKHLYSQAGTGASSKSRLKWMSFQMLSVKNKNKKKQQQKPGHLLIIIIIIIIIIFKEGATLINSDDFQEVPDFLWCYKALLQMMPTLLCLVLCLISVLLFNNVVISNQWSYKASSVIELIHDWHETGSLQSASSFYWLSIVSGAAATDIFVSWQN